MYPRRVGLLGLRNGDVVSSGSRQRVYYIQGYMQSSGAQPGNFLTSCVLYSSAIILLGKRELVALILLCSECHVAVIVHGLFLRLFFAVPCIVL